MRPHKTFFALSMISLLALNTVQADISKDAKKIIGETAVEYLKNNPEAFGEIIHSVQEHARQEHKKKQAAKIDAYSTDLFDTTNGTPFMGNAKGKIEVVVFMDPFCSYCRKFENTLHEAVKANKDLKIVARDIAIMHKKSLMLIKATIAASKQGKYAQMQTAVHKVDPSVSNDDVLKMAADLKLDMEKFKKDLNSKDTEALIKHNMDLADGLDVTATPTFLIKGSKTMTAGFVSLETFQNLLKS